MPPSGRAGGRLPRTASRAEHFVPPAGYSPRDGRAARSRNRKPDCNAVKRAARSMLLIDFRVGRRDRGPLLERDGVPVAVAHFHARSLERVEEQPPLRVGEAARRQRLVDLVDEQVPAADAASEQRFARLVRTPDLESRHARSPPTRTEAVLTQRKQGAMSL